MGKRVEHVSKDLWMTIRYIKDVTTVNHQGNPNESHNEETGA